MSAQTLPLSQSFVVVRDGTLLLLLTLLPLLCCEGVRIELASFTTATTRESDAAAHRKAASLYVACSTAHTNHCPQRKRRVMSSVGALSDARRVSPHFTFAKPERGGGGDPAYEAINEPPSSPNQRNASRPSWRPRAPAWRERALPQMPICERMYHISWISAPNSIPSRLRRALGRRAPA